MKPAKTARGKIIEPPARHDARGVLQALSLEMSRALRPAGFECLRAIPRVDGTLYFDLSSRGGPARLEWHGPPEEPGALFLLRRGKTVKGDAALRAARKVLDSLLRREAFELLGWYNRELSTLRFDDSVVDVLLAGRMEPGRTRWFSYVFAGAHQESGDRCRFVFSGPAGPVGLEVRPGLPAYDSPQAVLRHRAFFLVLVEDGRPEEKRKWLPHQVERFLGFLLSRAVHDGMALDPAVDARPAPGGGEPISSSRWGNARQWFQFFSDFEIERSNLCSFRFTDPAAWITHGEPECRYVEPEPRPEVVWWTCLPWRPLPWRGPPGSLSLQTNLGEKETVFGGNEKLKRALELATGHASASFVCVNNTCLPKIIGDDVSSAIEEAKQKSAIPIFDLNTNLDSPDSAFEDLVRQAVEAAAGDCPQRRGVNLVGFPPTRGFRELQGALGEMGVEIASVALPDFGLEPLRRYCGATASVVYPHRTWLRIAENVLAKTGIESKVFAAPYGIERTASWLRQVAAAAGKAEAAEEWLAGHLPERRRMFEELKSQAARYSIGVVVDGGETERLFSGAALHGFELAPLLEDLGFSLRIMVRAESCDESAILDRLAQPFRHRVLAFDSPAGLAELLEDGDFQLVLTEIFFDRRITRAGKVPLHLDWLELGFDGALRSLRRLLRAAAWPFYSTYRRCLA